MSSNEDHPASKVERSGNVTIFTFLGGKTRNVANVLASELEGSMDQLAGNCHLLLDFTHVEYLNSSELGTLIKLHKKLRASGGRLTLFNLSADVYEVFAVTRLQTLLGICRESTTPEQAASEALRVQAGA